MPKNGLKPFFCLLWGYFSRGMTCGPCPTNASSACHPATLCSNFREFGLSGPHGWSRGSQPYGHVSSPVVSFARTSKEKLIIISDAKKAILRSNFGSQKKRPSPPPQPPPQTPSGPHTPPFSSDKPTSLVFKRHRSLPVPTEWRKMRNIQNVHQGTESLSNLGVELVVQVLL